MRYLLLIAIAGFFFTSCNNSAKTQSFCDTTCTNDSIRFKGNSNFDQTLVIGINNCKPDSITWANKFTSRTIDFNEYVNKDVRLNPSFVNASFQDTTNVWLSFNDCFTGRGFLLKLPYSKSATIGAYSAALNSFDKKFSVDPDLRAYTDGGNIYVVNVSTGKQAEMTFKEAYDMDYDNIHTTLDSVHVTKERIYVKLIKEDKEVPLEKSISL
jgi:hypothetical protein